jgi:hypothetical protein
MGQVRGQLGNSRQFSIGISMHENHVTAGDIPQLGEAAFERGDSAHDVFLGRGMERSYPIYLRHLLTLSGEWRDQRTCAEGEECSTVHYSIA